WLPLGVNLTGSQLSFHTTQVPSSSGPALFRVRTTDGFNNVDSEFQLAMAVGDGNAPFVHLLTPNLGDVFPRFASMVLHASAWDLEDLMLPDSHVTWSSSLDGVLGTGIELPLSDLTPGQHVITVTGTDSHGMSSS